MQIDKSHPYIKFYGRDWIGDTSLRMCDLDERGLWIDLLCLMMQSEPYGHLAVNGRAMTSKEASRMIGVDEDTYKGILYRLIEKGIPSKTEDGIIYSRRLIREHKRFMEGSKAGKRGGGNPALHPPHPPTEEIQNPDTRIQIPESKGTIKVPFIGVGKDDGFDLFWKAYPKKKAKIDAMKAWGKAKTKPPIENILQAVKEQSASDEWVKEKGRYIPYPATWINAGRWSDELTITATGEKKMVWKGCIWVEENV
jgi:hypothetical protein